jgi:hypothetical protein
MSKRKRVAILAVAGVLALVGALVLFAPQEQHELSFLDDLSPTRLKGYGDVKIQHLTKPWTERLRFQGDPSEVALRMGFPPDSVRYWSTWKAPVLQGQRLRDGRAMFIYIPYPKIPDYTCEAWIDTQPTWFDSALAGFRRFLRP